MYSHFHHHRHHAAERDAHTMRLGKAFHARGGRRHRVFDSGGLKLVLLKLIEESPRHGYDLIREIEARSGGAYVPSPGVVYPTLTLLFDIGLLEEASSGAARKLFEITEGGRTYLAEHATEVEAAMARLATLADVRRRIDAAPVQRAMQNLKAALHNRLSQEGVDKSVILDVAALIDQAASKIERS